MDEATELFNYINNDARLWHLVDIYYMGAERAKRRDEYVPEYLEANLFTVVAMGVRGYTKEYGGAFSFDDKRACAKLLVKNFEDEIAAGNGWLG